MPEPTSQTETDGLYADWEVPASPERDMESELPPLVMQVESALVDLA